MKNRGGYGFTVIELVVGIGMLAIVMSIVAQGLHPVMRQLGYQTRADQVNNNLKHVIQVISSEVKLSGRMNPYLYSRDLATENSACDQYPQASSDGNQLRFPITLDSESGQNGRTSYLVGYRYDESRHRIFRGQVALPNHSCENLTQDPFAAEQIFAEDIHLANGGSSFFIVSTNKMQVSLNLLGKVETNYRTTDMPVVTTISLRN